MFFGTCIIFLDTDNFLHIATYKGVIKSGSPLWIWNPSMAPIIWTNHECSNYLDAPDSRRILRNPVSGLSPTSYKYMYVKKLPKNTNFTTQAYFFSNFDNTIWQRFTGCITLSLFLIIIWNRWQSRFIYTTYLLGLLPVLYKNI